MKNRKRVFILPQIISIILKIISDGFGSEIQAMIIIPTAGPSLINQSPLKGAGIT
jgi:hypothetical protein